MKCVKLASIQKNELQEKFNASYQTITTEVINGSIHIDLPKDFTAKRVELIILPADNDEQDNVAFQRFLLDSPEMTDEEFQAIEEKRGHLKQWT